MDVEAVHAAAQEAIDWCRAGKGPIILEMKTYRYRGHSMSDPAKYRTREEVQTVREKRDPIEHLGREADRATSIATEDELKAMDKDIAPDRQHRRRIRHRKPRARRRQNFTRTCWHRWQRNSHARAFAHDGRGQARQMAGQGRRRREVRRHPRRDRNRQGDDGIRSGRRRPHRQDSCARRHRRREGQSADRRPDGRRRRGRSRTARRRHACEDAARGNQARRPSAEVAKRKPRQAGRESR